MGQATYLVYWTGAFKDMKVLAFADRDFAKKTLDKMPNDTAGEIVDKFIDLKALPGPTLVAIYNGLSDTPVKRFADKDAAARRVFDLLRAEAPNLEMPKTSKKAPEPKAAKAKAPTAEKAPRAFVYTWPDKRNGKTPRDGTKYAQLLGMVAKGTTQAKIAETFGWNRQAVYDGLWYLGKQCGFGIVTDADGTIHLETKEAA